ncbi:uncharacterized protein PAC_19896 [Phialocephala subalpina]|uniref:Xylanolytic transcriptional activator regulatory domain-containing protein n=1 Tax=Phialocephala subalpina TaxID=576137 RepID=A0A1L7XYI1_9HELO|nr:uncharacterized protein PAC_19896 [Phialocephala subalpina]
MNFQPISKPSITIEDITLTAGELNSYLSYFFENMHCHFPFLERPFLPPKTLSSSPLLFWTIITVSSSFPNRSLYERLQPIVRRLLASGLCPFAMSQELCQALCLLCLWPLEASDPNDDPHFMYAGMATHIAMQMGLHRPQFTHEFKQIKELGVNPHETPTSRWMTWCACIFVEHQLASKVGVPCGVRDLWALQKSLNHAHPEESPPLPSLIRHQLLLIFLRDRYLNTVSWDAPTTSGLCEPPMRLNILKLFSTELDQWESRHDMLEETTSVLLHATRVLIAGFCLAADLALVEHQTAQATILLLLHRGVDSATAVLNIVAPLAWETLPVHIIRAVRDAGVFSAQLLRIERSQPSSTASGTLLSPFRDPPSSSSSRPSTWSERSSFTDDSTLICLLDRAIDILRSVSYGRDFSTRNKILLEVLRQEATAKDAQTSGPDVESQLGHGEGVAKSNVHGNDDLRHLSAHGFIRFQARMGANIFWDAVEYGKGAHDWTQNEKDIFLEMQSELG